VRRLLQQFEGIFDLDRRVGGEPLRRYVEAMLARIDAIDLPEFGLAGAGTDAAVRRGRFVSFYYRPHLFPGMELTLRLAHKLQFHLLPRELPPGSPVSIAAVLESFCHLSGDLFGWRIREDGRFLVWIVDISGHGVQSGLCSAVLKILFDRLGDGGDVTTLLGRVNRTLCECLRPEHDNLFATGFVALLDLDGRASYASAGHPPMLLRRAGGAIEELTSSGIPIGIFADAGFDRRALRLAPRDALLLYTDGLVETKSRDGELFGLQRLRRLFGAEFELAEELTGSIYREIAERQDLARLEDDVTFLAARIGPGGSA